MKKILYFLIPIFLLMGWACKQEEPEEITRISASENVFTEGDANSTIELTLTLEGAIRNPVSVDYSWMEFTAEKGIDFNATDGTVEFTPDQLNQTISFEIVGDDNLELEESFSLSLEAEGGEQFGVSIIIEDRDNIEDILTDADGFYTPDSYPSMTLAWADEFDGTELNTDDWTYEIGDGCPNLCGWGNNELQTYSDAQENLKIEDGFMTITAISEGNDVFTSSRIITKDKVELTYGRIDIRAKMPKGQGMWPAIWMLGANIDDVSWPKCGEIDIMELVGHEPATTHGTVHFDRNGHTYTGGSRKLESGDLSDQFHVYSIVWEKDKMSWYLDNELFKNFGKTDSNYPFNAPFFFIMNIAVGGFWPGPPDATTVFPQTMVVDYIRVFQ